MVSYHDGKAKHCSSSLHEKVTDSIVFLLFLATTSASLLQVFGDGSALSVNEQLYELAFVQDSFVG
jgi:hypothetical protein